MEETEFLEKTMDERLEWYEKEITNLFDFLIGQESFQDEKVRKASDKMLEDIKNMMQLDLQEFVGSVTDRKKVYLKTLQEAYKQLPQQETPMSSWLDRLAMSGDIIMDAEMDDFEQA